MVGDFLRKVPSKGIGKTWFDVSSWNYFAASMIVYQIFITKALRKALPELDRKIKGFASNDAILTAIEARSSAVLRITRDKETLESNITGIYPSGEGAGYAGGITSSAID